MQTEQEGLGGGGGGGGEGLALEWPAVLLECWTVVKPHATQHVGYSSRGAALLPAT